MIHFDLPKEKSSIIKVIGVGGGGSNAVNQMFGQNIEGVNFIICNTDAQAIAQSLVPNKVQLGPTLTQGLGAGANPDIGRQATEESLEEIKQILEVNTKMAFITVGMGGGTGTGGGPIIAKICKDLGILTVGIVTTPFSYEGKKRQIQAEEGIRIMKQYVDTLLVISNDKLRHQFGNLKMKEAFAKADNVLATAAKCITDVINSTGQINVDFADVCTVMRSGGVAILGNAATEGENRAQRAIEEALNSPLLNDNDIRGAKWILININSSEGEFEFTMDEVEIIQNYLLSQAGESTDVILGLGYENTLGPKLGITLIATGFEHKDPFKVANPRTAAKKEEKILMSLGSPGDSSAEKRPVLPIAANTKERPVMVQTAVALPDEMSPRLVDPSEPFSGPAVSQTTAAPQALSGAAPQPQTLPGNAAAHAHQQPPTATPLSLFVNEDTRANLPEPLAKQAEPLAKSAEALAKNAAPAPAETSNKSIEPIAKLSEPFLRTDKPIAKTIVENPVEKNEKPTRIEWVLSPEPAAPVMPAHQEKNQTPAGVVNNSPASAASGGYLARPSNIYAEEPLTDKESSPQHAPVKEPVLNTAAPDPFKEEEPSPDMQLVFKEDIPTADAPRAHQAPDIQMANNAPAEDPATRDDADDPKRRAADRINKLRNLSFNINAADPNNEFETVPAYIRRNLELYNTISNVENFYSNYEVKTDDNNNTEISTINTFLDGKRPD